MKRKSNGRTNLSRLLAVFLLAAFVISSQSSRYSMTEAAKKAKKATLKTKSISMTVGQKKKIAIKNKKKKAVYTFTSKKKSVAKVSKKGQITAKKAGRSKITVKEKYKKKTRKVGTIMVTVKRKGNNSNTPNTPSTPNTPNVPSTPDMPNTPDTPSIQTDDGKINISIDTTYTVPSNYDKKNSAITTYGTLKEISYYSTTTGKIRKANIILPAGYTNTKKYPILYLLHGIGGDHNEWLSCNPVNVIGNLVAAGEAKDMIVVMPNVRARANDAGNPSDIYQLSNFQAFNNFINDLKTDLMPYINSTYSVADGRKNTAIAGLSMGGRTSLYIGFSMQETFGYIGAFEPAPGVLPYDVEDGLFNPKSTFKLSDEYNNNTYVLICKGTNDTTVGNYPLEYHNTLTENGTTHSYYETAGGHEAKVWSHGLYNFARRIFK